MQKNLGFEELLFAMFYRKLTFKNQENDMTDRKGLVKDTITRSFSEKKCYFDKFLKEWKVWLLRTQ